MAAVVGAAQASSIARGVEKMDPNQALLERPIAPLAGKSRRGLSLNTARIMAPKFLVDLGHWEKFRSQLNFSKSDEVDLHFGKRDRAKMSYAEAMAGVTSLVRTSLEEAQRRGRPYVVFIHGSSTSRRGKTTARSQVRNFMRSKAATPLIDRRGCIQHNTVFIAKLKPGS
jgi:hypothetical protein